mmetsp:Transcript_48617/g.56807  ORF Transcript_48617/g.56807 Transcript_48617/m.56807 type:complete len:216 (-) Transcript_48617:299-946(-)
MELVLMPSLEVIYFAVAEVAYFSSVSNCLLEDNFVTSDAEDNDDSLLFFESKGTTINLFFDFFIIIAAADDKYFTFDSFALFAFLSKSSASVFVVVLVIPFSSVYFGISTSCFLFKTLSTSLSSVFFFAMVLSPSPSLSSWEELLIMVSLYFFLLLSLFLIFSSAAAVMVITVLALIISLVMIVVLPSCLPTCSSNLVSPCWVTSFALTSALLFF